MRKLFLLVCLLTSLHTYAQSEDCSAKDNYLQGFIQDYYHYVYLTAQTEIEIQDGSVITTLEKGQTLKVLDTNILSEKLVVFDVTDLSSGEHMPQIIFKAEDGYEATVADLEKEGLFKVECSVITADEHYSQLGRWYYEHRLRKSNN